MYSGAGIDGRIHSEGIPVCRSCYSRKAQSADHRTLNITPYYLEPNTLHPTSYILHPTPYTLHPTPYTLHPTPYTLHPTTYALHPTHYTAIAVGATKTRLHAVRCEFLGPKAFSAGLLLAFVACFNCFEQPLYVRPS